MKVSALIGERFRETPSECVIDSHIFMLRGGYMKYVASGIYSQLTPLKRICQKVEKIVREEMDSLDAQEVLFPVVLPGSLWEESGRYDSVGSELLRFTDRGGNPMVLGMTHEEAAVHLVREYGQSYQRYPFAVYQIQTKFRDEARPRGGLIRVREFTMKDAYSFHISQEDLSAYYMRCHAAYRRIYERAGLPDVVSVASDSGMMGGSLSHEFMYLTATGEDSIAICGCCDYRANVEAAVNITKNEVMEAKKLQLVHTPNIKTIDDLCKFLSISANRTCKAVVYRTAAENKTVIVFMRGDVEVNETKLRNTCGDDILPAIMKEDGNLTAGFIGPYGLNSGHAVLFDASLQGANDLVCGANKEGWHYTGLNLQRDYGAVHYHDLGKVKEHGICPHCGKSSLSVFRGIEVGNIFQLGNKYTKAMHMRYLTGDGKPQHPVMGCYGLGIGRLVASVCEAHHDDKGPIWPSSIAPWQVQICCIRADDAAVKSIGDELYHTLTKAAIEILYDDRAVSAGVMFSDADLFGIPVRVIISPRGLSQNIVEITARDRQWSEKVPLCDTVQFIMKKVSDTSGQQA